MTNHWQDIKNADVVLIMGGNAAEAHPCGFKWVIEAKTHNKAKLIVVDPRFTRSAAMADYYAPIRAGTDIAFLGGVINYLLANDKIQHEYVQALHQRRLHRAATTYEFEDGLFSGYDAEKRSYDKSSWGYELDERRLSPRSTTTLQHPRCVYQADEARTIARYTPEMVSAASRGTPQGQVPEGLRVIASTAAPDRAMTIMYALGWTQHSPGSQIIRTDGDGAAAAGQHRRRRAAA